MEETDLPVDMMMDENLPPNLAESSIQLLYLTNNIILVTEVTEILAEAPGQPDCKLINPFLYTDGNLVPWLQDVTDEKSVAISSDKILTMVDPNQNLLDAYASLTQ
tara:strand:- start:404 stop:721 length:318 start_codon:yes stop_codon:yes gene_type:complete